MAVCVLGIVFLCSVGLTLSSSVSKWYGSDLRICFTETERSSQCQGPSHTCSGWSSSPSWTKSFRDDTDNRGGGCKYQWRIEARREQYYFGSREYRLCFTETEGSSQCQGTRHSCTSWSNSPSWTSSFRDDTDNRGGGCRYAWKIESRHVFSPFPNHQVCRVCFKETEGSTQCQGYRQSCSGWTYKPKPAWTRPFRDDTDNRGGGCRYQWYLDCVPPIVPSFCRRNIPCYRLH